MERKGLVLVITFFCLLGLAGSATVVKQFNASDYYFAKGTLLSGNINNTNISDSISLRMLEAAYNSTNGMASFQLSASATTAQYQQWLGTGWDATGAASTPPVTAGTVQFTRIRASPAKDEKLLVTLDSNSDIDAQVWDG
ncbi:MAG TPA: hypothetical protein VJI13_00325, partial [Candidatus Norongarragalinales archaeon]|nr:hypothetical protein [Candidatus Norongarragalinales archaeon]